MSYTVTFHRCRKCGNKTEFLESGKYTRNVICDEKTGEFKDYDCLEMEQETLCCAKCDSTDIEFTYKTRRYKRR